MENQEDLEKEIALLRQNIGFIPSKNIAHTYNGLGMKLAQNKKNDEAILAYRKALEIDPNNASIYNNLGLSLARKNKLEEAITQYRKAIELDPIFAIAYGNLGYALKDQNKLDEAITEFNKAIEIDSEDANFYNGLGLVLEQQNKSQEALNQYQKAINIDPKFANAYNNIGYVLIKENKLDEAKENFEKAIKINPDLAAAYNGLGIIFDKKNNLNKAIAAYKTAIGIDSEYVNAYSNLGNAMIRQGLVKEGIKFLEEATEIEPQNPNVYINLANAQIKQGNIEQSIETLREGAENNPNNFISRASLAEAISFQLQQSQVIQGYQGKGKESISSCNSGIGLKSEDKGKIEEIIENYQQALELAPNDYLIYNQLGLELFNLAAILRQENEIEEANEQLEEAVKVFKKAIEINSKDAMVYINLGYTLISLSKQEEAIKALQKALEITPKSLFAHNGIANALSNQNKLEEAIAEYRKAIEVQPECVAIYNNLGNALTAQALKNSNQPDVVKLQEAIDTFQRAIDLNPNYFLARLSQGYVLLSLKKYDEARKAFDKIKNLTLDPKVMANVRAQAYNAIGQTFRFQGGLENLETAKEYYKIAIDSDPNFTTARDNYQTVKRDLQWQGNPPVTDCKSTENLDPIRRSVVVIQAETQTGQQQGTGWVIKKDKNTAWIVTARHIITGEGSSNPNNNWFIDAKQIQSMSQNITVYLYIGKESLQTKVCEMKVLDRETKIGDYNAKNEDQRMDIAVLKVTDIPDDVHPLNIGIPEDQMLVHFIGHPEVAVPWDIQDGKITSQTNNVLQITRDRTISRGFSGGPVLNKGNNQVIGMIYNIKDPYGFAYPINLIYQQLQRWQIL